MHGIIFRDIRLTIFRKYTEQISGKDTAGTFSVKMLDIFRKWKQKQVRQ